MAGKTVTLSASSSSFSLLAFSCQRSPNELSRNWTVAAWLRARFGRYSWYFESPVGARIESESAPPSRKTDTRTVSLWPCARAMPSWKAELRGPVDREHRGARAEQERAPVEPGSGRQRHAALDRGQAAPRLCRGLAQKRGARVLPAIAGHLSSFAFRRCSSARLLVGRGRNQCPQGVLAQRP